MAMLGGVLGIVLVTVIFMAAPGRASTAPWTATATLPAGLASASPSAAPSAARSFPPPMSIDELYRRFERGGSAVAGGSAVDLSTELAGELEFQTGRVVASDAYLVTDDPPFTRWLVPGRHLVFVLHAMIRDTSDDRLAAAMIRARPGDPVRWEMALRPRQNMAMLGPDQFFGYGVDAGTGCFTSAEASEWLAGAGAAALADYEKRIEAAMFPSPAEYDPVADIPLGDPKGRNVIVFSSGWGDGVYPSYFGLDAEGRPLVLVTDFQILNGG
jgi:uncharacterized protein DUF4241